jgi:hypothetical protein
MNRNDNKTSTEDAAKKIQNMVSLGIPDTMLKQNSQPQLRLEEQSEKEEQIIEPEDIKPENTPPPIPSRTRRRKDQPEDYRGTYFKRIDFSDRQPLYITRNTHEKLMLIVNVIGGRKATISSYVENIILQHLENHKEEINCLFDEKFTRPITDK